MLCLIFLSENEFFLFPYFFLPDASSVVIFCFVDKKINEKPGSFKCKRPEMTTAVKSKFY